MPRQPYYESQVDANSLRSSSPLQSANSDPNAFGAGVGKAMQQFGEATGNAAQTGMAILAKEKAKSRNVDVATSTALFDFSKTYNDLQNESAPDAADFQDKVRERYAQAVDDYTKDINDDDTRNAVRTNLIGDLPSLSARASQYQQTATTELNKSKGNAGLNALQNKINSDPVGFDQYKAQGDSIIDALPDVSGPEKAGMRVTWGYDAAKRHFEGQINNVKSIDDIDNIASTLASGGKDGTKDWQKEMLPADYESTLNMLGTMRKSFNDKTNTDARAVLGSIEDRINKNAVLLPSDELTQMQETVKKSTDPSILARAGRIMRSQEIIRQESRLPPAEIRARINASNGDPSVTYPGLPPEVSTSVNKWSTQFGVPASYLGATANHEYGGEFAKAKKVATEDTIRFKPQVATKGIDLRNVSSAVVDGVTDAGRAYGAPLIVRAADPGVNTPKTAINISTVGMDGVEKAKVASSLADAGFTGFSEYNGYMQADMLPAVPASFGDKDGKAWGGWTYLSPEVAATLKDKGFTGGADAGSIKRTQISSPKPQVDYAAPTRILGDDGKPTSTATGLYQFTEGTWLTTIKKPEVAAALGIDVNQSDEALLKLRSNPDLQTGAAAALASSNMKELKGALGRDINDAELYMAHFMGAGGATTFLTGLKNQPEQSAAKLLPESAKANKPIFYDKGGRERTVQEVNDLVSQDFTLAPSKVAYEDNQLRQTMVDNAEKLLKTYPIQQAMQSGSHVVTPLTDPGGFVARGVQAQSVADYYSIPAKEMKPFTQDEEASIKKTIADGTVDDNLALMANIEQMGTIPAKGALKQLDQTNGVFAHAADLYLQGNSVTAGDIVRGAKRMKENPAIEDQIGATKQDLGDEFVLATGSALNDMPPERRQVVQDAATALYVEKMANGAGGSMAKLNKPMYDQAVQEVLGGNANAPALDMVNGTKAYLPKGLTGPQVETAFQSMTVADWTRMSETGEPPMYPDGGIVNPKDIADEVTLRSIGGGQYKLMLDDGKFLSTGKRTPEGRMKWFIFTPDAEYIKNISSRSAALPTDMSYNAMATRGQVK